MVALCVVLTILSFLTLDYFVERTKAAKRSTAPVARGSREARPEKSLASPPAAPRITETPGSVADARPAGFFAAPGHVWAELTSEGTLWLGLDQLAARFLGAPDEIATSPPGAHFTRGAPIAAIRRDRRTLTLRAPCDGTVAEINTMAARDPRLLPAEPYGAGRICRIEPDDLEESLRAMRAGAGARAWMREELARLRDVLSAAIAGRDPRGLGETLADGGAPIETVAQDLDAGAWTRVAAAIEGRSTIEGPSTRGLGALVEERPS